MHTDRSHTQHEVLSKRCTLLGAPARPRAGKRYLLAHKGRARGTNCQQVHRRLARPAGAQLVRIGMITYRNGPLILSTPGLSSSVSSKNTSSQSRARSASTKKVGLKAMMKSAPL